MDTEEDEKDPGSLAGSSAGPMLFKKRNKGRGNLIKSNSPTPAPARIRALGTNGEGEKEIQTHPEDEGETISSTISAVQRSAGSRGGRSIRNVGTAAGMLDRRKDSSQKRSGVNLTFIDAEDEEEAEDRSQMRVKKSDYAEKVLTSTDEEKFTTSLPDSFAQARIGDPSTTQSAYSPATLAMLRAENINRPKTTEDIDSNYERDANTQMNLDGESFTRMKFAADFAHDGIPSEAVINAAKEKRKRAMEAMNDRIGNEDFISLNESEPHPHSRIPREEDEEGSGEEEFAQYTGATERIALDKEGIEKEKVMERQRRKEELELHQDDEMSGGSGREWEEAQMQREVRDHSRHQRTHRRERSPFRPAPIPQTSPLPTLVSTSARMQKIISGLQDSIQNQDALHNHAQSQLDQLNKDENRNKIDTEKVAEREAWFREFEQFITSMAKFLEKKMLGLAEVESDWLGHLVLRTDMIQRARADALTDQISLFYGVPQSSLFPGMISSDAGTPENHPRPPIENGDALSSVRAARRPFAESVLSGKLSAGDQAAFDIARNEIKGRADRLLDDVQAAEYRDPGVRVNKEDEKGEYSVLHPASLVARFHRWRRLYPEEYSNAWGGLTLASMWDFWIRKSMCGWDALSLTQQKEKSFDQFQWYSQISHYTHLSNQNGHAAEMDQDEGMEPMTIGSDDEMIQHIFTNTIIPSLIRLCDKGGFDPWNEKDNGSMLEIMEQISYVMEKDNLRFQSLVASILRQFERQINALTAVFTSKPATLPPAMAIEAPNALLSCTQFISKSILRNLLDWHKFVQSAQRPFLLEQVNLLIEKALLPLFGLAQQIEGGKEIIQMISQDLIRKTARSASLRPDIHKEVERCANL